MFDNFWNVNKPNKKYQKNCYREIKSLKPITRELQKLIISLIVLKKILRDFSNWQDPTFTISIKLWQNCGPRTAHYVVFHHHSNIMFFPQILVLLKICTTVNVLITACNKVAFCCFKNVFTAHWILRLRFKTYLWLISLFLLVSFSTGYIWYITGSFIIVIIIIIQNWYNIVIKIPIKATIK